MNNTFELTIEDLNVIKESLKYSKQRIEDYQEHPSYEIKQQKLAPINEVALKVSELIRAKKSEK
jgi:hypothetical protein